MDIEQLKLILDAAYAAGDGAFTIILIWFALKFFVVLAWFGGTVIFVVGLLRLIEKSLIAIKIKSVIGYFDSDNPSQVNAFLMWLNDRQQEKPF